MNRVLIASKQKSEFEWLQNELIDFATVIRNVTDITLLKATSDLIEANVIIILDSVVFDDDQLISVVNQIVLSDQEILIVFVHARDSEGFKVLSDLKERNVICLPFIDLEPGTVLQILMDELIKERSLVPDDLLTIDDEISEHTISSNEEHDVPVEDAVEVEHETVEDVQIPESDDFPKTSEPDDNYTIKKQPEIIITYHVTRKIMLVGSFDRSNGASFVARNLAYTAAARKIPTALIELPLQQPYHFDRSLMTPGILQSMSSQDETHFQESFVNAPYLIANGQQVNGPFYVKDGVTYLVSHPDYKITQWTDQHSRKLLSLAANYALTIVDVGINWMSPSAETLKDEAHEFVVVQQAEPARLERLFNPKYFPAKNFEHLIGYNKPISIFINQYHHQPLKEFYYEYFSFPNIHHHIFLPWVDPGVISKSAISGNCEAKYSDELFNIFCDVVERWIPQPIDEKKKNKLFRRIRGKFRGGRS